MLAREQGVVFFSSFFASAIALVTYSYNARPFCKITQMRFPKLLPLIAGRVENNSSILLVAHVNLMNILMIYIC